MQKSNPGQEILSVAWLNPFALAYFKHLMYMSPKDLFDQSIKTFHLSHNLSTNRIRYERKHIKRNFVAHIFYSWDRLQTGMMAFSSPSNGVSFYSRSSCTASDELQVHLQSALLLSSMHYLQKEPLYSYGIMLKYISHWFYICVTDSSSILYI